MRNKSVWLAALLVFLASTAASAQPRGTRDVKPKRPKIVVVQCYDDEGNPIPCNDDPGSGGDSSSACRDCIREGDTGAYKCVSGQEANWSPCKAQVICQSMPGGGTHCYVDCGQRCFSI